MHLCISHCQRIHFSLPLLTYCASKVHQKGVWRYTQKSPELFLVPTSDLDQYPVPEAERKPSWVYTVRIKYVHSRCDYDPPCNAPSTFSHRCSGHRQTTQQHVFADQKKNVNIWRSFFSDEGNLHLVSDCFIQGGMNSICLRLFQWKQLDVDVSPCATVWHFYAEQDLAHYRLAIYPRKYTSKLSQ